MLKSIGIIDAMSALEERIQLIGGVRWQSVQVSNWSGVTGQPTPGYDANAVTPSVSLIVRPWKEVSFYGNFIQALEQGQIAGAGLANAGQVFPPFVSTQFEAGTKLDLGNFGATLSAFQITRPSSFINPISNSLVVDGQQRNRGIEFTMFGEPLPGLRPIGGFSVLHAIQTNTLNGTNNGKYAAGVPTFQANVGLDWETPFVKGLAVGGRIIYTGSTYLDPANLQPAPALDARRPQRQLHVRAPRRQAGGAAGAGDQCRRQQLLDHGGWLSLAEPAADGDGVVERGFLREVTLQSRPTSPEEPRAAWRLEGWATCRRSLPIPSRRALSLRSSG